jgi:sialate O-acetylesterase
MKKPGIALAPVLLALALLASASLIAAEAKTLKLPAIFGDHMVLQRDGVAPMWGTANPGDSITVSAGAVTGTATADANGKWMVGLKNLPVSDTPIEVKIQGPKDTIVFKDVLVGDVWLASGQSNMNFRFSDDSSAKTEQPLATNSLIRLFYCGMQCLSRPTEEIPVEPAKGIGVWRVCSPSSINPISAVGYYFARDIAAFTRHPVALIHTAVGGSSAESWTSLEALSGLPALSPYADKSRKFRDSSKQPRGINWKDESANFNGGLNPYIPFGLKGVVWYQGESNATRPDEYRILLPVMIQDWRTRWGQGDFPFIIVQLPKPCGSPEMAQAQAYVAAMPRNGLAVTYDIGAPYSIAGQPNAPVYIKSQELHPKYKRGVGSRLALAARKVAYGDGQVVCSGPMCKGITVEENKVRVHFDSIGGGLMIGVPPADWYPKEKRVGTDKLLGFDVAGKDGKFQPATAVIDGVTVVVSSPEVPNPTLVRYGWHDLEKGLNNLYNQEGLPAVPFRSDELFAGKRDEK